MIATVALVLGSFALLIVRSYKRAESAGERYQPVGKRWTEEPRA